VSAHSGISRARGSRTSGRRITVAASLALAFGLLGSGSAPRFAAAIDPCFGYDLCVHLSVVAMGHAGENGDGWVTSTPSGIQCRFIGGQPQTGTSSCDHYFHANFVSSISVQLDAVADTANTVICDIHVSTGQPTCSDELQFASSTTTAYQFHFAHDPVTVNVGNLSKPGGFVYSTPMALDCGEQYTACSASWPWGTNVTLFAEEDGASFLGWTGTCVNNNESCELYLQLDVSTTAVFGELPTPTPIRTPSPTSTPKAKPTPSVGTAPTHTPGPAASGGGPGPSTDHATGSEAPHSSERPPATGGGDGGTAASASPDVVSGQPSAASSAGSGQAVPTAGPSAPFDVLPLVVAIIIGCGLIALGIIGAAALARRGRSAVQ
jgi:hypothetical protein